jgi:PAS domain S-box-containing protein
VTPAATPAALIHGAKAPPRWLPSGVDAHTVAPADDGSVLAACELALIDAATVDAVQAARSVRAREPVLHIIIVTTPSERARLERSLLFAPGIGEVWVVEPSALDTDTVRRAAEVTRARRAYRGTRAQLGKSQPTLRPPARDTPYVSDAYLAALLEVLPDPVLSVDDADRVVSWSAAAEQLLQPGPRLAADRTLADIIRPANPDALQRLLEQGRREAARGEIEWRSADGARRTADVAVTPVSTGDDVRAIVFRDTTEQTAARQQLEEQAAELEAQTVQLATQADELALQRDELEARATERATVLERLREVVASRSRFYASMSHEIRTPINAILGYNDLLLAGVYGELTPEQTAGVQRAQIAARHLRELVDDILDLSKIESGKIGIAADDLVLSTLVSEVVATVEPLAREHDTPMDCRLDDDIVIRSDARRVRQILLNLLSNAVKFGAGQPVTVTTGRLGERSVFIEVRDRGRGIAPDRIQHIFEEFVQLDSLSEGGTGLGLSISKRLAAALGGSLAAASTVGVGSTFTLTVPLGR